MTTRQFAPELQRLLIIKGICRFGPPLYVLWSLFDWYRVDWRYAVAFGVLTFNYLIVLALTWTFPALMNGPWRVRPWQTFILLINAIALPIMFYRTHGQLPWLFFLAFAFLVATNAIGTAIFLKLNQMVPKTMKKDNLTV